MAEEEDKKLAESWQADAEGILVFVRLHLLFPCFKSTYQSQTGLFSAAVASLISVSIQDLQQNPQDTSNFYLGNIYQLLADPNRPNISNSLPTSPPSFSPPAYAVLVNSLWFLSLCISITCALLATLLQQWARRYLRVTQPHYSLPKRARIRSFFAEGVEKSLLPLAVEALPTMLHVSLFLFFAGLVVFLSNVNLTIFKLALSWIGFCAAVYGCITLVPIVRRDSPYYTPLTPLVRLVIVGILHVFHSLCACVEVLGLVCSSKSCSCFLGKVRLLGAVTNWFWDILDATSMKLEKAALLSPFEIDTRALMWTFDRLDEDHELESFFSGLPGFQNSKAVRQPLRALNDDQRLKLATAMIGLLDRTFSSDLLPDQVKHYRSDICTNAVKLVDTPNAFPEILRRLAAEGEYGPVSSTDIVRFVKRWDNHKDEDPAMVQAIFSVVVARIRRRDDPWFILASSELGIPEAVLRKHSAHGHSLSLVILIYITRQQLSHFGNTSWPSDAVATVLRSASNFDVQNTSLELQHEFCALWNQVVRKAQGDEDWKIAYSTLSPIRKVYITLHQGTNCAPTRFSASTRDDDYILMDETAYPLCNVLGHIHDNSASTTISQTIPTMYPPSYLAGPNEGLTTVLSLDNDTLVSESQHPAYPTAVESFPVPSTSQGSVPGRVIQGGIDTSATTLPFPIPELSLPIPLPTPAFPPGAVSVQHFADSRTPSNVPSLPSPAPAFENTLPISLPSLSDPPRLTSVPDHGAVAEGEGRAMAAFRNEEGALNPSSAPRKDILAIPGIPCSSSITSTSLVGPSRRSLDAEDTRNDPPHPSHGQYDIV